MGNLNNSNTTLEQLATPFNVPSGTWTLAVLPDTQGYACDYPEIFLKQTDWIAAHRDSHQIRFVVHLGDITENNIPSEWQLAQQAMNRLHQAHIPYLLSLGNHDLDKQSRSTLLNDYFQASDYGENTGFFEQGKLDNSWKSISTPTGDFLFLALEFTPRDAVLQWANEVVSHHPHHVVVVVAHAYLYWDGNRFDWDKWGELQEFSPTTYIPEEFEKGNDGEQIWGKFISKHSNIAFVLCGHVIGSGAAHLVSEGAKQKPVHQIVSNYQPGVVPDRGEGGAGFLRLMRFLPDGKTVEVRTYSPWLDQWLTDPLHQFDIQLV